jgi:hypothetical protein
MVEDALERRRREDGKWSRVRIGCDCKKVMRWDMMRYGRK